MIYPPINQLVEKTGNKYELVIATAKRARTIANAEKAKEKQPAEQSGYTAVKSLSKADKVEKKAIVKAIDDIVEGKVYILKNGEGYKTEGFEETTTIAQALETEE